MKEGWLKILKPVTLEITIFREEIRTLNERPPLTYDGIFGLQDKPCVNNEIMHKHHVFRYISSSNTLYITLVCYFY